uniref:F-box domain-containing protein n=1 Tax=Strongyloides papillosus TaxID=174720 RepID=A0A0N5BSC5_STREA
MDATKEISFTELMKIDGVRRHILKYALKFSDIKNLARTCRSLCVLISGDSIGRDIMWIDDYSYLTIKCKRGFKNVSKVPIWEKVNIIKNKCYDGQLEEGIKFYGETINYRNGTFIVVNLDIGTYTHEEHVSLVQKIAEKIMLNHQLRSDVETLDFRNICDRRQRSLLIECISYMNHGSVKRIKLPVDILKNCKCLRNPNVWVRDMFDGFPDLNEVYFSVQFRESRYKTSFGNGSTILYIIKSLSKKRNGTIIFRHVPPDDVEFIKNVRKIYGLCDRYGVKIKLEIFSDDLDIVERSIHITNPSNAPFSINSLITVYRLVIHCSKPFPEYIENFRFYENLEVLNIRLYHINFSDGIKDTCMSDLDRYSFRNCRKLKEVTLYCMGNCNEHRECTEEMFVNNLLFIGSLMPDTVERLKIINYQRRLSMSSRITEKLSEYMPNVKMLTLYDGEFKNCDCLGAFKNLEIFITRGSPIIEIPKTIKLFVADLSGYIDHDKEIVRRYSKRFLKYLHTTTGEYIFFNDITQWRKYKCVIQKYHD